MIIHVICRGNVFRSLIAEAYLRSFKRSDISVVSSGTVADEFKVANKANYGKTIALLREHGIAQFAKTHYADQLTPERLAGADMVICMNQVVFDEASNICELPPDTIVWDVADLGEKGRIVTSDAERQAYSEDVYREIIQDVDGLMI